MSDHIMHLTEDFQFRLYQESGPQFSRDVTEDFRWTPFWQEALPSALPGQNDVLPPRADVVIVGGGLTGVEAARVLSSAGRHVVMLDAGDPGKGASTRNAGQIGRNFKHSFGELNATLGLDKAKAYFEELTTAYQSVAALGAANAEAIGWHRCGRVVGALGEKHLDRLHTEYDLRARHLGEEVELLDGSAVSDELGSDLYKGGVRVLQNGAIHPGKYYGFMHGRAIDNGATVIGNTPVLGVEPGPHGFVVDTSAGRIQCRDVLVATNGYTDGAFPWLKKRLAPINSCMIATEPQPPEVWAAILPKLRTYHDNRRRSHFMTFSPDGTRLIFGGRTGNLPSSLPRKARELLADLRFIFPSLADVKISHAWTGRCAATRDLFPHVGVSPEGLHYALGYCFSGNAMGPYLARKAAAMILGHKEEAQTLFHSPSFPTMPLLARGPWLMPTLMSYYAWVDRPRGLTHSI